MSILSCPMCEEKFQPGKVGQETCSRKCRGRARYLRKKADGTGYVPRDRRVTATHEKSCAECGAFFVGLGNQKFCTATCREKAKHRRKSEAGYYKQDHVLQRQAGYKRAKYRSDLETGSAKGDGSKLALWSKYGVNSAAEISPDCVIGDCRRPRFARLKCKPHYEREMRLAGKSWAHYNEIAGDDYRRRAEKFGVPFERFNKFDIYDRDGWMCGLCAGPVDPELMYPDPMSVSLDHVIPLSRGGGHIESNTQCSHLTCNVRKGARDGATVGSGTGLA